jgi:hypothetical protein
MVSYQQKQMVEKFQYTGDFFAYALWMLQQKPEERQAIQDYWFWLLSVKEDARGLQ